MKMRKRIFSATFFQGRAERYLVGGWVNSKIWAPFVSGPLKKGVGGGRRYFCENKTSQKLTVSKHYFAIMGVKNNI
jgi:hypothetical protein